MRRPIPPDSAVRAVRHDSELVAQAWCGGLYLAGRVPHRTRTSDSHEVPSPCVVDFNDGRRRRGRGRELSCALSPVATSAAAAHCPAAAGRRGVGPGRPLLIGGAAAAGLGEWVADAMKGPGGGSGRLTWRDRRGGRERRSRSMSRRAWAPQRSGVPSARRADCTTSPTTIGRATPTRRRAPDGWPLRPARPAGSAGSFTTAPAGLCAPCPAAGRSGPARGSDRRAASARRDGRRPCRPRPGSSCCASARRCAGG